MDVTSLTAVELGKKIRERALSVTEAVNAYFEQIERV